MNPPFDVCFFCRKRVYVMERLSAEGKFFHRSCFKCDYCGTTLRLASSWRITASPCSARRSWRRCRRRRWPSTT
uniref:LIM zinc-binding domain-containing protein n=1 Tax=Oryzias melastigma TaxID=30732 RepID=A0A3B3E0V3_ORYME